MNYRSSPEVCRIESISTYWPPVAEEDVVNPGLHPERAKVENLFVRRIRH